MKLEHAVQHAAVLVAAALPMSSPLIPSSFVEPHVSAHTAVETSANT